MRIFSRRKFIQGAAVGTAALGLGWNGLDKHDLPFQARALRFAPVYTAPGGEVVGHLTADSVLTVRSTDGYFSSEHGFIAQADMQPMLEITPVPLDQAQPPFYVEVIDPSIALRAYVASDAETIRRVGHGAFLQIIGTLPERSGELWYETADHHWVAPHGLSLWIPPAVSARSLKLEVDQQRGILSAYADRKLALQTPFVYTNIDPHARQVRIGDWIVQGAHNHNQFVAKPESASTIIDIPAGAARMLHTFSPRVVL